MTAPRKDSSAILAAVSGFGAWIATGFFMMLLGVAGFLDPGHPVTAATALALVVGAQVIHRTPLGRMSFGSQLVLAGTLSAQGAWLLFAVEFGPAMTVAALFPFCAAVYAAFDTTANRVAAMAIFGLTTIAVAATEVHLLAPVLFAALVTLVCVAFGTQDSPASAWTDRLRPAAYTGAALALGMVTEGLATELWEQLPTFALVVTAVAAIVLVAMAHLEHRGDHRRLQAVAVAIGALGLLTTPAILLAVVVSGLGLWRRSKALVAIGAAAALVHLSIYYYQLDTTLLVKSGVLVGSGLVLLVLRHVAFAHRGEAI